MARVSKEKILYGDPDAFAEEMSKMIDDEEWSDIKFLVGDERRVICSHRSMLAARCAVFRAMLSVPPSEGEDPGTPLVLSDISPPIFLSVLEFIYTNSCKLSSEIVSEVLRAAIEFGLDGLRRICVQFMRENMSVDTVCEYIQAALLYEQVDLQGECLGYIEERTEDVFKTNAFREISDEALSFILQSDLLNIDEVEVLSRVKEWAGVNAVASSKSLGDTVEKVIGHVRFPLLDQEYLTLVEKENEVKRYIPVSLISSAWRYHARKEVDSNNPQLCPRRGTVPRESLQPMGLGVSNV